MTGQNRTRLIRAAPVRERLRTTLASIGDAVITTDAQAQVTSLNAVAQTLTGWGQDQDQRKSKDAGFDHHLVKPVDYEALRQIRQW